jgi:hypothetical protein
MALPVPPAPSPPAKHEDLPMVAAASANPTAETPAVTVYTTST